MIIFQRIYIKGQQVHERILNITVIKEMQIKASMITSGLIWEYACMHAKLLQSCLTLCDPMNCSPPGSSVHGILQAGILEWVDMLSSRGSSQLRIEPTSLMSPTWLLLKQQEITNCGMDVNERESLCTVGGTISRCSHYGKQYGGTSKN